jgi:hypothetical protein
LLDFFRRHVTVAAGPERQVAADRRPVPPQIKPIVAGVKAFSVLIFITMVAAFILDFGA